MGAQRQHAHWLSDWIDRLGVAAWARDPDGRLLAVNRRGAELLGCVGREVLGKPCDQVVGGLDIEGRPFCSIDCPAVQLARDGRAIAPLVISVGGAAGARRWCRILVLPLAAGDEGMPCLVHCALPADNELRMRAYLGGVAARAQLAVRVGLTRREQEILDLLALPLDTRAVADRLHLSHVTVRNHVQHILTKLGAHSIHEAVARQVLGEDPNGA
jgi:DNA-binding CsgD family transcriptional regulator